MSLLKIGEHEVELRWGPYSAQVRLGELSRPPNPGDLGGKNGAKKLRAMIAYAWACMDEEKCPWVTPTELAREVDRNPDALKAISEAVVEAMAESQKKTPVTESAPSSASKSG